MTNALLVGNSANNLCISNALASQGTKRSPVRTCVHTHLGEGAQRGFCARMTCGFSQELVGHEEMPLPCRELQIGKVNLLGHF